MSWIGMGSIACHSCGSSAFADSQYAQAPSWIVLTPRPSGTDRPTTMCASRTQTNRIALGMFFTSPASVPTAGPSGKSTTGRNPRESKSPPHGCTLWSAIFQGGDLQKIERSIVLTERQREVLVLVRRGLSNREIGEELGISEDGVKAHLSRLYLRFGVTNRVEMLNAADERSDHDAGLSGRTSLGTLRAIAGRADVRSAQLEAGAARPVVTQLETLRNALAAVDVALELVGELPAETTGAVVDAVRKRLATALVALEVIEKAVSTTRTA